MAAPRDTGIHAPDGELVPGLASMPSSRSAPWIVVIQKTQGLTAEVRRQASWYARCGYRVFVPDLLGATDAVAKDTSTGLRGEEARAAARQVDPARVVDRIRRAIDGVRAFDPQPCPVGVVASGWGSRFAVDALSQRTVEALALLYPNGLADFLLQAAAIAAPLGIHFAALDEHAPASVRCATRRALVDRDDVEVFVYPGADHGFTNSERTTFDAGQDELVRRRLIDFFSFRMGSVDR